MGKKQPASDVRQMSQGFKNRSKSAAGLMLLVITIWALNLSLIKISLVEIAPLPFNGIRLLLASLVLLIALVVMEGNLRIERRHLLRILLLSLSGHTLYQYLFIEGFALTTASNSALILGTSPILISLISSFNKHERLRWSGWLGIVLGASGAYLVITGRVGGMHMSLRTWRGDLLVFLGVVLWALYSVSARPLLKIYSPLKFTALTMGIGSLAFFPLALRPLSHFSFPGISFKAWFSLAFSGAMALSLAYVLWFVSIKWVGNSRTAVFSNLQPVLAILLAHLLLKEALTSSLLAGTSLILCGIYFTRRGREAAAV